PMTFSFYEPFIIILLYARRTFPYPTWGRDFSPASTKRKSSFSCIYVTCELVRKIQTQIFLECSPIGGLDPALLRQRFFRLTGELSETLLVRRIQIQKIGFVSRGHT